MSDNPALILASGSPRRAALLRQVGLPFEQIVSPQEEAPPAKRTPAGHVALAARAKARAVHRLLGRPQSLVIGADTIVCLEERLLGKPAHAGEARAMLRALGGRIHQVYTGVALVGPGGGEFCDYVVTQVRMRPLSAAEITSYIESGEPFDKAGAYGIQGRGARFIEYIEGCYYNVVGLPLARLCALLEEAGYEFE